MMEGLEEQYELQFQEWLKRRCNFPSLHFVMSGSFSIDVFHARCDNKGPTITLFYDTEHNVYGGYASQSWRSNAGQTFDDEAFLFTLRIDNCFQPQRFPVKNPGNALYCDPNYGPCFGCKNSADLRICEEKRICEERQNFMSYQSARQMRSIERLNRLDGVARISSVSSVSGTNIPSKEQGSMKVNIAFGENFKIENNRRFVPIGQKKITSMKVFAVRGPRMLQMRPLLDRPWRGGQEWTTNLLQDLKQSVESYSPFPESGISAVNILLVGKVSSGKSSFFNSIESALRGKISSKAAAGVLRSSYTTNFKIYKPKGSKGNLLKFRVWDTTGIKEESGLLVDDAKALVEGKIKDGYRFDPKATISTESPEYIPKPTEDNKVHCLVYVVDSIYADAMPVSTIEYFREVGEIALQRGIPQLVLLTKIDELCDEVDKNLTTVFTSSAVLKAVKCLTTFTGLPMNHVLPVKNYHNEVGTTTSISILVMQALRQMLAFADDYLENLYETSSDDQGQKDSLHND